MNTTASGELIALTAAAEAVRAHIAATVPGASDLARINYRLLYMRVLDGRLPAAQIGGRWFLRRAELPIVAERLGYVGAKAPSRARRSAPAALAIA